MASNAWLPPWSDPAWSVAAATPIGQLLITQLKQHEAGDLETPLPQLTPELYSQVHRTGERAPFERVYTERRRRLARGVMRLLLEPGLSGGRAVPRPNGRWWEYVLASIRSLLDEPSWAWPAHVNDPSGVDSGVIDLFAAKTAHLCASLVSVLGLWLPPAWLEEIRQRVVEGMVVPFVANPSSYGWTKKANNWNSVCHQGLLGAALVIDADTSRLEQLLEICRTHLERFLDGFTAGGSCLEGITYWEYGFGWFALLNEQLEQWSAGQESLMAGREARMMAIAAFGPAMLLSRGQLVNFSDSRLDMPPRASLLRLLGRRLELPNCEIAGLRLYQQLLTGDLNLDGQRCDLLYLTRLVLEAPTVGELQHAKEPDVGDWIDPSAQLAVCRRLDGPGRCWELAVKGGHNGEPHNHNDCGSYLLNVDGQRFAIELVYRPGCKC
ncbi:MAG: hypothetical protein WAM11_14485 [Cyanobium sp.]